MRRRSSMVVLATLLAGTAGIASGSAISASLDGGGTDRDDARLEAAPGTGTVDASAPDPDPAMPGWAVRIYRSRTGLTCPELGRSDGSRFGNLGPERSVEPRPEGPYGACGDLGAERALAVVNGIAESGSGPRTVVFGTARGATLVALARAGTALATAEPGRRGGFVVVLAGSVPASELRLSVTYEDGSTESVDWTGRR